MSSSYHRLKSGVKAGRKKFERGEAMIWRALQIAGPPALAGVPPGGQKFTGLIRQ
jgi:hypothetical protein